ncbi:hypothetical protein T01_6973 [Trichinella spiralis]|uniref:Uncharacterized protein n=1 Tax=Trichinella spiralis TaxID=6334 RepID=A0A0V1C2I6_TRISP|nr:hypothetical protein T01_6973 [Trichinella spiralis]
MKFSLLQSYQKQGKKQEEKSIYAFWLLITDLEKRVHNHLCSVSGAPYKSCAHVGAAIRFQAPRLGCVVSNRELKLTVLPKHKKIVDQYLTIENIFVDPVIIIIITENCFTVGYRGTK